MRTSDGTPPWHEVAIQACQGVLLGLFRADEEEIPGVANFFFEGFAEYADAPLLALPGTDRDPVGNVIHVPDSVKEFAREHLPHWEWLHE